MKLKRDGDSVIRHSEDVGILSQLRNETLRGLERYAMTFKCHLGCDVESDVRAQKGVGELSINEVSIQQSHSCGET